MKEYSESEAASFIVIESKTKSPLSRSFLQIGQRGSRLSSLLAVGIVLPFGC
jgi:hypothetical protein